MKKFLKTALLIFTIATLLLFSATGCLMVSQPISDNGETANIDEGENFDVLQNAVAKIVNKYGIIDEFKSNISSQLNGDVTGLMEAKAIDLNYDGNDELYCVYFDGYQIHMEVYENINNNAELVWNDLCEWGGIFTASVLKSGDDIYWHHFAGKSFVNNVTTYKEGKYINSRDFGEITEDERAQTPVDPSGFFREDDVHNKVHLKRVGIEPDSNSEEILYIGNMGILPYAGENVLTERWNLTFTGPKPTANMLLSQIPYYGDASKCIMPKEMALAYIDAIKSEQRFIADNPGKGWNQNNKVYALLMDVANDGMPLLITAIAENQQTYMNVEGYVDRKSFNVWTWDGSTAKAYDFNADCESDYSFGISFYPENGDKKIVIGDGLAQDWGAMTGTITYDVSNAQLTKTHHSMFYTLYISEDNIGRCQRLPGVKNIIQQDEYSQSAYIEDIFAAGWTPEYAEYDGSLVTGHYATIDGKSVSAEEYNTFRDQFIGLRSYDIFWESTGASELNGNYMEGDQFISLLTQYAEVAGKPSYAYEEVSSVIDVDAIAKAIAKDINGEIGEIFKISDDLYYVIIYVDGNVSGGVVVKNTSNGKEWRIVSKTEQAASQEELAVYGREDQKNSNIEIDYQKTSDGATYLEEVISNTDGTKPNDIAKDEITEFAQKCVSESAEGDVKASKNHIKLNEKAVKESIKNASQTYEEIDSVLSKNNIKLNKPIMIIINIVCKNANVDEALTITLDESLKEYAEKADEIVLKINENHSIRIKTEALINIINTYGSVDIVLEKVSDGCYTIRFTDENGEIIDKMCNGLTVVLPASGELCTVLAEYKGGTDNWGGQYDSEAGTISFETSYSGTYTVSVESIEISDISNLTEEQQKAIRFMVSKGYFSLDGDKFNPESTLTRYVFSEALVRIFFALDRSAKTTLTDVPADSPYYPYVASGQNEKIIEGYEDMTFRGNNNVLREEVIALCSRTLCERKGYKEPESPEDYISFADSKDISGWARPEVALAVRETLIAGEGNLYPQNAITRADSAVILYRLFMLLYEVEPVPVNANNTSVPWLPICCGAAAIAVVCVGCGVIITKRKKAKNDNPTETE